MLPERVMLVNHTGETANPGLYIPGLLSIYSVNCGAGRRGDMSTKAAGLYVYERGEGGVGRDRLPGELIIFIATRRRT